MYDVSTSRHTAELLPLVHLLEGFPGFVFTSRARVTKMSMAYGRYSKQYRARHGVIGCCRRSSNCIIHGITLTITIFSLRVADRTGAWKLVAVNPCLVEGATIFMNGWANDVNWFLETTGSLPNQYLQLTDDNWMQVMGGAIYLCSSHGRSSQ
jgi:hypothetical protein